MLNFFKGLYTLQEIAIHHNFDEKDIKLLSQYSTRKQLNKIAIKFPQLSKFIPYCEGYRKGKRYFYAMPAYLYDTYCATGFLVDMNNYDTKHDANKKEYWRYNPSISLDLKPQEDWEFAEKLFEKKGDIVENDDVWKIFLAGCARMDFYQGQETSVQQRIKYAIAEYMLKRPQFFTTDDFVDNPILHKKYSKE